MSYRYDAVLFDLLTALFDSWTLWDRIAGDHDVGRAWRLRYLELTYETGQYRPYTDVVRDAAQQLGLPSSVTIALIDQWECLEPWPEVPAVLRSLGRDVRLGVVTNCAEQPARRAIERIGQPMTALVTAERVGWYKPDPRCYRIALSELHATDPERVLYVAGSPYDVLGAARVGMPVYWHNRLRLQHFEASSRASRESDSLHGLLEVASP
jgi:2-haloalkanoic acid dehalogenase type II